MYPKISIIMPAYNEERNIGKKLEAYGKFFSEKKKSGEIRDFEILIVINNTKDNTETMVQKYQKQYKEVRYLKFKEGGKGFATLEGFKDALTRDNDLIGFVDVDMSTPAEPYYDLITNIGNYGGIIASRWTKGAVVKPEQDFLRKIMSRGFNFIVRSLLFLPYSDTQCGAKLFKRDVIKTVLEDIGAKKWAFDVELLYKVRKHKIKIKEIPTFWQDVDTSAVNLVKTPLQMFSAVVRLRMIHSPFRFIVRLYDNLPEKIKIHH